MKGRRALHLILLAALLLFAARAEAPASPDMPLLSRYEAAPFGPVLINRPTSPPRGVALFLSDGDGVTGREMLVATALARQGVMVALLSTPDLMHNSQPGPGCLNFNYPLIALSNDVQHRMALRAYMKPVIMGLGEGGTLAYASLAQWPKASYAGVLSIDYRPALPSQKPWCAIPGFSATQQASGWSFGPNRQIGLPWVALQSNISNRAFRQFAGFIPGSKLSGMSGDPEQWRRPVVQAVTGFLPQVLTRAETGTLPIPDMPLTLVPAPRVPATADMMAILYSGDGGWVGIDHDVADQLARAGIPVVGVDSLAYFWTARTPEGAAHDLGQLIDAFSRHWERRRILLVGYSFGADVMPHMVERLSPAIRAKVAQLSLLGLSDSADFQFHLSSWLNVSSDNALPTIPAIRRLNGLPMRCVRGQEEQDSACPSIPAGIAQQYLVPGDHHFNRNASLLAAIIMGRRAPGKIID